MKKVVIVDDMKSARNMLSLQLKKYKELEIVAELKNGQEFINYLESNSVDLVFLDIEMPGIDGLSVAKLVSQSKSNMYFAFATAFSHYSLEAWGTNAIGYLTKPYNKLELQKIIERFLELSPIESDKIVVKCFPNFNVFIGNTPIAFNCCKCKEILAYLVYNRGGWVRVNEICAEVLEELDEREAQDSYRSYMSRLKRTLESHGIAKLIEKQYGQCRIVHEKLDCDYYNYLDGNQTLFAGEFLKSYEWAEPTQAKLQMESIKFSESI